MFLTFDKRVILGDSCGALRYRSFDKRMILGDSCGALRYRSFENRVILGDPSIQIPDFLKKSGI
jgi:hypothetical protein